MTTTTIPTAADLAESIKADVLADVASGVVPATVRTFGQLHDHADANCYGGTEALIDAVGLADAVPVIDAAQTLVSAWIAGGGIAAGK